MSKCIEESNPETIRPFSIVTSMYEKKLDLEYGIDLGYLQNGRKMVKMDLESKVFFKDVCSHSKTEINNRILKKYESLPDNCSMIVENMDDLYGHIENVYRLSYSHYVWAKEINMRKNFPNFCCTDSSSNIFLSLMNTGYPNSMIFIDDENDHTYVGLPFLIEKNKEENILMVDPTSNQIFNYGENAPRNLIFVAPNERWKYETDWENGADLYPSHFANLGTLREARIPYSLGKREVNNIFERVFENPVEVNPKRIEPHIRFR